MGSRDSETHRQSGRQAGAWASALQGGKSLLLMKGWDTQPLCMARPPLCTPTDE